MFCVIQEIETKKTIKNGYSKEIETSQCGYEDSSRKVWWNCYYYGDERFERPIKKAYRISIHQSYRENGKVRKKQYVIGTYNYYDLADKFSGFGEFEAETIDRIAELLGVESVVIYDLIEKKLNPLVKKLEKEFQETEEYKTHQEHERIITEYGLKKAKFNKKYEVDGHEYDMCYDVFGNLTNPECLKKIKKEYKERKEYEKKSRSYQRNFHSNYNENFGNYGSGYQEFFSGNYDETDKEALKRFYRVLSKKFHPDANPDIDTSKEMQLLNRLKDEWGV